jgi:hypothetical protein
VEGHIHSWRNIEISIVIPVGCTLFLRYNQLLKMIILLSIERPIRLNGTNETNEDTNLYIYIYIYIYIVTSNTQMIYVLSIYTETNIQYSINRKIKLVKEVLLHQHNLSTIY